MRRLWLVFLIFGALLGTVVAPVAAVEPAPVPDPAPPVPVCDFADAAAHILASTVQVEAGDSTGTAFAVGDGEFLTAAHVIQGATRVHLWIHGERFYAEVGGYDEFADLALLYTGRLALPAPRFAAPTIAPLSFGDATALRVGEEMGVAGFPAGVSGEGAVTSGRLSKTLTYDGVDYIQTSAEISPGNSGSPLFTECGDVVGVIVYKLAWRDQIEGIGFAVALPTITDRLPALRTGERASATLEIQAVCTGKFVPQRGRWRTANVRDADTCRTQAAQLGGIPVGWGWGIFAWVDGLTTKNVIWRIDGEATVSNANLAWAGFWLAPGPHTLEANEWRDGAYVGWSAPFTFMVITDLTVLAVCDNDPYANARSVYEALLSCHGDGDRVQAAADGWWIFVAGHVTGDREYRFGGTTVVPWSEIVAYRATLPRGYTTLEIREQRSWGWTPWSDSYGIWVR